MFYDYIVEVLWSLSVNPQQTFAKWLFFFNITKNENEAFISTNVPKIMKYMNLFLSINTSKIYKRHNSRICRGVLCFQIKLN